MRYAGREYRVVCTQSAEKQLTIDIVPADSALHLLILKERKQRDKSTREIAGSIKLYDMGEGNRPEILFLPPENGGLPEHELSAAEENRLRYKITARFEDMMAQNQESTITVRKEIHQAYVMDRFAKIFSSINADFKALNAPQSLQEEQNAEIKNRQIHAAATRAQTQEYLKQRDEKYTKHGVSALQIKQLLYRDY